MNITTVGDLVTALLQYDPSLRVLKSHPNSDGYVPLDLIEHMLYQVRRVHNDSGDDPFFIDDQIPFLEGDTFMAVVL